MALACCFRIGAGLKRTIELPLNLHNQTLFQPRLESISATFMQEEDQMPEMRSLSVLLFSVFLIGGCLAAGVGYSALQVSKAYVHVRTPERTVVVKGLSERRVKADFASWSLSWWSQDQDREKALAEVLKMQQAVKDYVTKSDLKEGDWTVVPLSYRENVDIDRKVHKEIGQNALGMEVVKETEEVIETRYHQFSGTMEIGTEQVEALQELARRSNDLLNAGIVLQDVPRPVYTFSGLNQIKPGMIEEATKNARSSATRFAEDSGSRLGAIISADQGNVRFLPRGRDGDEKYYADKVVRVVTSVRYYLVD